MKTTTSKIRVNKQDVENIRAEIQSIHQKLDSILNVRVNGTVGLEAALQELYAVTKGLRATKKFNVAFKEWFMERRVKLIVPVLTFLIGWLIWGDLWMGLLGLLKSLFGLL